MTNPALEREIPKSSPTTIENRATNSAAATNFLGGRATGQHSALEQVREYYLRYWRVV